MRTPPQIDKLLECFSVIGKRIPTWTQGQGSNLSWKDKATQTMWIKPSGYRLDEVKSVQDLVQVDLRTLREGLEPLWKSSIDEIAEQTYSDSLKLAKCNPESELRPSMETGFHMVLDRAYVFHFHSLVAVVLSDQFLSSPAPIKELCEKHGLKITWISYATPGLSLTRQLINKSDIDVFVLENHGIILHSEDAGVLTRWQAFEVDYCDQILGSRMLTESQIENFDVKSMNAIPLRIFFPDLAVYLGGLLKVLVPIALSGTNETGYQFDPSKISNHRDLHEIWMANWLLFKAQPALKSLSEDEVLRISRLPTEQYRILQQERSRE